MSNLIKYLPIYNSLDNIQQRQKNFYSVLFWNYNVEKWLAFQDLPPTRTSRIFYYFHMLYYSLYLALIKNSNKNIFPNWMNFSISIPDDIKTQNVQDVLIYGIYRFCLVFFSQFTDELDAILSFCTNGNISSSANTWITNLVNSYITKINSDYSASPTNPTWPSVYTPPVSPVSGEWRPLQVPNGTFLNSWNTPWVNPSDPTTFTTQNYATPNWGGLLGYEWNRVGAFNSDIQNILDKYTPILNNPSLYDAQMQEVKNYNGTLTPRQKFIAEFWEAGKKTAKPCGMWNQITRIITKSLGLEENEAIELFFILNAALANAFILAWDIKRTFASSGGERPVTYLRRVLNTPFTGWKGNTEKTGAIDPTQPNQGFLPYQDPTFVTPPFPGFISGHSTCSSAASVILTKYLGSGNFTSESGQKLMTPIPEEMYNSTMEFYGVVNTKASPYLKFDTSSDYPKTSLCWKDFLACANEASLSRLLGGIHILADNQGGIDIGEYIGNYTWNVYQAKL